MNDYRTWEGRKKNGKEKMAKYDRKKNNGGWEVRETKRSVKKCKIGKGKR